MRASFVFSLALSLFVAFLWATQSPKAPVPNAAPSSNSAKVAEPKKADLLPPVYAKALEGDMRAAVERLRRIPSAELDAHDRKLHACMLERFDGAEPPEQSPTTFVEDVIAAYRAYWRRMLRKETEREAGEAYLTQRLRAVLAADDPGATGPVSQGDLLEAIAARLDALGFHSLHGRTEPYLELLIWRSETSKIYEVTLPDGTRAANVVLLRDFQSLGWSAFATCDHSYTGGWAETDNLYCVADSYDLSSERFTVSFLTHETQHFSDYERFPKLEGPELEYRAKLAELMESKTTTRNVLGWFAAQSGESDSRDAPHSLANRDVVRDLARELGLVKPGPDDWSAVSEERIRSAAAVAYRRNTELLVSMGAATVSRALRD